MKAINETLTAERIMNGDMPEMSLKNKVNDSIILINDTTMNIYANILMKLVIASMPQDTPDDIAIMRLNIYDTIMEIVCRSRCGRLRRLTNWLDEAISTMNDKYDCWPSTRIRNNVFGFVIDWWFWDEHQRNDILVIEEVSEDIIMDANAEEA